MGGGEALFRGSVAIEPDNSAWLSNLGEIHRLGGELDCAEELFREAILKSPIYSKAYNNLGLTLHSKEQYYEAETVLRKAIELDPQNATAENNLGNALYAQEKAEEAVSHYRQAIALSPKYAKAYNGLALALQRLGKGEEAVGYLKKAVESNPRYGTGYFNLAGIYRELGRNEAAMEAVDEALRIDPNCTDTLIRKGVILLDEKKTKEALKVLRCAAAAEPDNAEVQLQLARAYLTSYLFEEAKEACDESVRLDPGDGEASGSYLRVNVRLENASSKPPPADGDDRGGGKVGPEQVGASVFGAQFPLHTGKATRHGPPLVEKNQQSDGGFARGI